MSQLKALHAQTIIRGHGGDAVSVSKPISFCALSTSGDLQYAHNLFDRIPHPNGHIYNTLIRAFSNGRNSDKAIYLYLKMVHSGISPNEFTFPFVLKACAFRKACVEGSLVYLHDVKLGFSESYVIVQNGFINFYASSGMIDCARKVFDWMECANLVSWNYMIGGYAKLGLWEEAFLLFGGMREEGVESDGHTFVSLLSVCSRIYDVELGKFVHWYIQISGIPVDTHVQNALLDMYAKCGHLQMAEAIFQRVADKPEAALDIFLNVPEKNVFTWNTIINAVPLHGSGYRAIELFQEMEASGIQPDSVTFSGLLSACCHCGLVEIGRYFFYKMGQVYKIHYDIEHYACVIDILGGQGLFMEALGLIGKMSVKPDIVIWGALLGACRIHRNVLITKLVLKQILELESSAGGLYVLISNIFSEARQWEQMKKMRKLMKDYGLRKNDAVSSIKVDGCIFDFMVDDKKHEASNLIYATLNQLKDHLESENVPVVLGLLF